MTDNYVVVVIDDERVFPQQLSEDLTLFTYTTSDAGLAALKALHTEGLHVDELWLDHDLGEDLSKKYGWDDIMPVVSWLEERAYEQDSFNVGCIMVHTANAAAAPAMLDALRPHYRVIRIEFPQ